MTDLPPDFAARLLRWFRGHGRTDLPWQGTRDPYRVWLSEVMLQQTQVTTVIDYFNRFLDRFPDVASLAAASEDEVLALWSGLGYYSRARNLHRCAQQVMAVHGGSFPVKSESLAALPGIGRSTAAAIAAFCHGERVAILDGNVKRVMARMVAFDGDVSSTRGQQRLWTLAGNALPRGRLASTMPAYTQAIMDLGASVCSPRKPKCDQCPMQTVCAATRGGEPERFPIKKPRAPRRSLSIWLLVASGPSGEVWLTQRGSQGVWARLFCPPEYGSRSALLAAVEHLDGVHSLVERAAFPHALTHRDLSIHVVAIDLKRPSCVSASGAWYSREAILQLGLPTPVRNILSGRLG